MPNFASSDQDSQYEYFEVLPQHVALLKNSYTSWIDIEFGAAGIDPKRPYGNSDVLSDIAEILNYDLSPFTNVDDPNICEDVPDEILEDLYKFHSESKTALQIFLCTGEMKLGWYRCPKYRATKWELCDELDALAEKL